MRRRGVDGSREMSAKNRDFVASVMTPAQIAEAQRLAREGVEPLDAIIDTVNPRLEEAVANTLEC
jgi:hypothetical protein